MSTKTRRVPPELNGEELSLASRQSFYLPLRHGKAKVQLNKVKKDGCAEMTMVLLKGALPENKVSVSVDRHFRGSGQSGQKVRFSVYSGQSVTVYNGPDAQSWDVRISGKTVEVIPPRPPQIVASYLPRR